MRKCLAKEPENRWQSAKDLHDELKWVAEGGLEATFTEPVSVPTSSLWKRALTVGVAVLMGAIVTGIAFWSMMPQDSKGVTRFDINIPTDVEVDRGGMAFSADGRELVYVAKRDGVQQLYRRPMDQFDASPIRGTEGAWGPFFSPDGQWVGFFTDELVLKKVSLAGGPPVTICDTGGIGTSGSWGPDDTVSFGSYGGGIMQVRAAGGEPRPVATPDRDKGEIACWFPDILPGGEDVLLTVWYGSLDSARIAVQSLETEEREILVDGSYPRYSPTGHIVFAREDSIWAVPFDVDRLEVSGEPTPLLEGIYVDPAFGFAGFALSGDGSLAYMTGSRSIPMNRLVLVDRRGAASPLTETSRIYLTPRFSPDGERLAVTIHDQGSDRRNVWVLELSRDTLTRLTFGDEDSTDPVWSPDGQTIAFAVGNATGIFNIFSKAAGGISDSVQLTANDLGLTWPRVWSPDGGKLVFQQFVSSKDTGYGIGVLSLEGEGGQEIILGGPFFMVCPSLSPDGRWLAYASDESGQREVYVQAFLGPDRKWQVSTDGGSEPLWAVNGRELFYRNGDKMMAVPISTEPQFSPGRPALLFEGKYAIDPFQNDAHNYDVSPDGQHFVMIQEDDEVDSPRPQIKLVLSWFEEYKRLAPTN